MARVWVVRWVRVRVGVVGRVRVWVRVVARVRVVRRVRIRVVCRVRVRLGRDSFEVRNHNEPLVFMHMRAVLITAVATNRLYIAGSEIPLPFVRLVLNKSPVRVQSGADSIAKQINRIAGEVLAETIKVKLVCKRPGAALFRDGSIFLTLCLDETDTVVLVAVTFVR